jgi:hypothetical protein
MAARRAPVLALVVALTAGAGAAPAAAAPGDVIVRFTPGATPERRGRRSFRWRGSSSSIRAPA